MRHRAPDAEPGNFPPQFQARKPPGCFVSPALPLRTNARITILSAEVLSNAYALLGVASITAL
jgi:hypothetical protein